MMLLLPLVMPYVAWSIASAALAYTPVGLLWLIILPSKDEDE